MIKKILVPIDGSEHSSKAVDYALNIAEKYSAKVVILTVVHHGTTPVVALPGIVSTPVPSDVIESYSKELMDSNAKMLAQFVEKAKNSKPDLEITPELMEGRPADTIVQYADDEKFDIIIMGSRGLSGIKRFFLGSVSNGVINHAKCPVLLIK